MADVHQQFRLKSVSADHLVCRTWDGLNEGTVDVPVAKPYLLRVNPFALEGRAGVSFSYMTSTKRTATKGGQSESQEVIPDWVAGDLIYATSGIAGGTGVKIGSTPVQYLEDNCGRAWVKVDS